MTYPSVSTLLLWGEAWAYVPFQERTGHRLCPASAETGADEDMASWHTSVRNCATLTAVANLSSSKSLSEQLKRGRAAWMRKWSKINRVAKVMQATDQLMVDRGRDVLTIVRAKRCDVLEGGIKFYGGLGVELAGILFGQDAFDEDIEGMLTTRAEEVTTVLLYHAWNNQMSQRRRIVKNFIKVKARTELVWEGKSILSLSLSLSQI